MYWCCVSFLAAIAFTFVSLLGLSRDVRGRVAPHDPIPEPPTDTLLLRPRDLSRRLFKSCEGTSRVRVHAYIQERQCVYLAAISFILHLLLHRRHRRHRQHHHYCSARHSHHTMSSDDVHTHTQICSLIRVCVHTWWRDAYLSILHIPLQHLLSPHVHSLPHVLRFSM